MTDIEEAIIKFDGNTFEPFADLIVDALREYRKSRKLWVKVTERLPEKEVMVLVWTVTKAGHGSVNRAYYDGVSWHGSGSMAGVTHWMPLPGGPKENDCVLCG